MSKEKVEVSVIEYKTGGKKKFRVTRKIPTMSTSDTKVFSTKERLWSSSADGCHNPIHFLFQQGFQPGLVRRMGIGYVKVQNLLCMTFMVLAFFNRIKKLSENSEVAVK